MKTLLRMMVLVCAAAAACSSPDDDENNDVLPDVGNGQDVAVVDDAASNDAGSEADMSEEEADVGGERCAVPAVLVAGTPETDVVANAAERCGQAAHAWLRDPSLGEVLETQTSKELTTTLLAGLAAQAGIDLPRDPEHDTVVRQFSYVTQDRGQLVESTGLMAWPKDAGPNDELDVVLMLPGFNGVADACAWSKKLDVQATAGMVASYGYIAVMPDYIGKRGFGAESEFDHPAFAGQLEAISGIDAVRAALKTNPADRNGACATPRFAVFGASQGGHAALWVHRLAPYYGRELTFVGGSSVVPIANSVRQTELGVTTTGFAVRNAAMIAPLTEWYGADLAAVANDPTELTTIAADECTSDGGFPSLADATAEEVFTPEFLDAAANGSLADFGDIGCIYEENTVATSSVGPLGDQPPMLYVIASDDDAVDPATTLTSFDELCAAGMPMKFLGCAGATHHDAIFVSADSSIEFIDALFAGDDVGADCTQIAAAACD